MDTQKRHVGFITVMTLSALLFTLIFSSPVKALADDVTEKEITAKIPVAVEKVESDEAYTFKITGGESEYELIKEDTISLKSGEKGFFEISFDYPGTYSYTVSQVAGTDDKTTYDNTTYNVDIYVTESEDGALFAQPVCYVDGSDEKKAELTFKNVKEAVTPDDPDKDKDDDKDNDNDNDKNKDNNNNNGNNGNNGNKGNNGSNNGKAGNVSTGDTTNLPLWFGVIAICAALILGIVYKNKKEKREHH